MKPKPGLKALTVLLVTIALATSLGLSLAGSPANTASAAGSPPDLPDLRLSGQTHGDAAVKALGRDLSKVAAAYGITASELGKRLRQDPSLGVDLTGKLFYTCAEAPQAVIQEAAAASPIAMQAEALAPLENTFRLHSRAGSSKVIYLDFDGGTLSRTAWNEKRASSIVCPPWNTDGNASSFGTAERTTIQYIWQRVAEDYSPFDVDVTTEAPPADRIARSSSSDQYYGTRVLISPIAKTIGVSGGGVSYVGIFNRVDSTDYMKPALVFPENLGYQEKLVAEAATHEAGHNLGLGHDGIVGGTAYYAGHGPEIRATGVTYTGWAPIMGNSYYRYLSQWSKGEYPGANNTEDDLAKMTSYGLSYRADDHGNTVASASALPAGTQVSGNGVISTRTDVDMFRFTAAAGPITIDCNPADRAPDLDIQITLYNSGGTPILSNNPPSYLDAGFWSYRLPAAGTYYLRVDGVGKGDPATGYSDYGSVGAYSFTLWIGR